MLCRCITGPIIVWGSINVRAIVSQKVNPLQEQKTWIGFTLTGDTTACLNIKVLPLHFRYEQSANFYMSETKFPLLLIHLFNEHHTVGKSKATSYDRWHTVFCSPEADK